MAYFKTGEPFWSMGDAEVMERLQASSDGFTASEAAKRINAYGPNLLHQTKNKGVLLGFWDSLKASSFYFAVCCRTFILHSN